MSKQECPICGKEQVRKFRPFCSRRCSNLDLGNWFDGRYKIPTDEEPDVEDFNSADLHTRD